GGGYFVCEVFRPTVAAGPGELHQLLGGSSGQFLMGRPALQESEHGRSSEVVAGDAQGSREGAEQVHPQPVEQPALVLRGPLVVASDGAQLVGQLTMRDQRAKMAETV